MGIYFIIYFTQQNKVFNKKKLQNKTALTKSLKNDKSIT